MLLTQIRHNLWVGNYSAATDTDNLKNVGITAILNVAFDISDREYLPSEFRYVKINLADYKFGENGKTISADENPPYFKHLATTVLGVMLMEGETVLVHCAAGFSRSVYVVCRYLSQKENKHINDVYEEVRVLHPQASKGPLFHRDW